MDRIFRHRSIFRMSVEVETPTLMKPEQLPETSMSNEDHIILKFQVQNIFLLRQNQDALFVRQHVTRKIHYATHQLPVKIFQQSNGGSLQLFLSLKFKTYGKHLFNIKTIADEIIKEWTKFKEQEQEQEATTSSTSSRKVFLIIVTLKFWNVVTRREAVSEDNMMKTTSNSAIEMLTRVKSGKVECGEVCVICLEDIEREEECDILLLPCLHLFHEECIKKWLKNSHYCPTCRFEVPKD